MTEIVLSPIDRHFADFIDRTSGSRGAYLWPLAAILSASVRNGDTCIELSEFIGNSVVIDGETISFPKLSDITSQLLDSGTAGVADEYKPLILDSGRLYLHRYHKYETEVAEVLIRLASSLPDIELMLKGGEVLKMLFGFVPSVDRLDRQLLAAATATGKRLTVISGGPGRGKTSTVLKIVAAMMTVCGENFSVALAAPTGKGAARLKGSIASQKKTLPVSDEIKNRIPDEVFTLHRLAGVGGKKRQRRIIPHDLVVIDEASMIDIAMMHTLLTSIKSDARLILLGDRDQLASVDAGSVMSDICGGAVDGCHTERFALALQQSTGVVVDGEVVAEEENMPLADSIVYLQKNYRFAEGEAIATLAEAIRVGNGEEAYRVVTDADDSSVTWHELQERGDFLWELQRIASSHFMPIYSCAEPAEALQKLEQFRILAPLRGGYYGVDEINARLTAFVTAKQAIQIDRVSGHYHGRPIMITVNSYDAQLFNGDTGIIWLDKSDGTFKAFFPDANGGVRKIAATRLPAHETVYAMTVHKSQGSEFSSVAMVIGETDNELVTRELLYTGVTRGKQFVSLYCMKEGFITAVKRRIRRVSGLAGRLWG